MTYNARPVTVHFSLSAVMSGLHSRVMRLRRKWTPMQRYVVRVNREWAIIWIDERMGAFNCQSSYGTYAYIWRSIGDDTLKQFLRALNFDYFMGKTRPKYREFDFDRTCSDLKESICEYRRHGSIDKELARKSYDEVEWLSPDGAPAFAESLYSSRYLSKALGGDYCEVIRESPDVDSKQFWAIIWPEFIRQIGGCR